MRKFRGIPDPRQEDVSSIFHSVQALKEAVESLAGERGTREPYRVDAETERNARVQALATKEATALQAKRDADIQSMLDRITTLETTVADHETRITALETP